MVVRERQTDLVIIEGMGRAIHTNYYAMLSCESLKMAVIKNSWLADRLGGKLFSVVFKYEVPAGKSSQCSPSLTRSWKVEQPVGLIWSSECKDCDCTPLRREPLIAQLIVKCSQVLNVVVNWELLHWIFQNNVDFSAGFLNMVYTVSVQHLFKPPSSLQIDIFVWSPAAAFSPLEQTFRTDDISTCRKISEKGYLTCFSPGINTLASTQHWAPTWANAFLRLKCARTLRSESRSSNCSFQRSHFLHKVHLMCLEADVINSIIYLMNFTQISAFVCEQSHAIIVEESTDHLCFITASDWTKSKWHQGKQAARCHEM